MIDALSKLSFYFGAFDSNPPGMLLFRDELLSILTGILPSYAKIISKNVLKRRSVSSWLHPYLILINI